MKQCSTLCLLLTLLMSGKALLAQTPFWTQTFAGGIPTGWTTTDASNQNVVWTWCDNPGKGQTGGCPPIFDDPINQQEPFKASTAANGFMTLDSDRPGALPTNHISRLTSAPINCSGRSQVFVTFETHIGVYEVNAETGAILRVSTDGTAWTNFTIFPGLTTQVRWSANPTIPVIDISSVAANQSTVYLQWEWTGNWEYFWNLDDVKLYDADPTPDHNLGIGDFFYPASSFAQPASQIPTDTFSFGADLSNLGRLVQTNIVLRAAVTREDNTELWADSLRIPSLTPGVKDSFFVLPGRYVPNLPVGVYKIKYTVQADSTDQFPGNNAKENIFLVTNNTFSKEPRPEQAYRPSGPPQEWYVANLYTMSPASQENYQARLAQFTFTTSPSELNVKDVEASIYLLRVNDDVDFNVAGNFDVSQFLSPDLEWVGVGAYSAPDTMVGGLLQQTEILDLTTSLPGVKLDKGARYLLAIGYASLSNVTYHGFNDDVSYFFPSTFTFSDRWYTGGFGPDINAVLRMVIFLVSTTDEKPLADNTLRIAPNPATDVLHLLVELERPTDATITIADLSGRVILMQDYPAMTSQRLSYPLLNVSAGTYLARIATPDGTLTKKFVVQR